MTEANQNFSMVTRIVDRYGTAVIFKNNKPRYEVRMIEDTEEAETNLLDVALSTVKDEQKLKELSENIARLALPDSAKIIAQEVIKLAEKE
mgnify:CR=1 FL=1